jgi:hypothetical protein
MNLKKYMLLDTTGAGGRWTNYESFTIKIKTGITSTMLNEELILDWTPKATDRLYFFPGCNVPRFKVRDKYNTTIKPEYATAAFISAKGLKASDSMFDVHKQLTFVDGDYVGKWLAEIYGQDHHFVLKFKSLLLNCENTIAICDDTKGRINYGAPNDAPFPKALRDSNTFYNRDDDESNLTGDVANLYVPVLNSALNKITCPIYCQEAVIKLLNEDNIVIDEKKYEDLRVMANSSDEENIVLVMELISNANYSKSFVFLLLLLKEFKDAISKRRKEINHVNFKSLMTFLELDEKKIKNISLEMFVAGMKKNKQFTRINVQRVTQHFAQGMTPGKWNDTGEADSKHFITGPVLRLDMVDELDAPEEEKVVTEVTEPTDNFNL